MSSRNKSGVSLDIVILSEAKDLLSAALKKKQVLRFAQDDNSLSCSENHATPR
jgi:hypothetical protein